MLRVPEVSTLSTGWRLCAMYLCAMAALGTSAVFAAYAVSESIWYAATANSVGKQRDLSRVERFYAARAANWRKARPSAPPPVVALTRPDIHPAALAAAMDRTELASAFEHPEYHPVPVRIAGADEDRRDLDIASWRTRAIAVAGLTCSSAGCDDAENAKLDRDDSLEADADADQIAYAISDEAAAEAATVTMQQSKLGKANARQKSQRKDLGAEAAFGKFFTYQPGDRGLRVAETPGDIIRASLLRGTI